jgi:Zn-dependent protease
VLWALEHPSSFVVLVASFAVALIVRWVSQRVALALISGRPRWARRRIDLSIKRCIDPFGAIAAAIAGMGWGSQFAEEPRDRGARKYLAAVMAGPLAVLGLGMVGVATFRLQGGSSRVLDHASVANAVNGAFGWLPAGQRVSLLFAIACLSFGVLALLPLPPLDGGRVLFALAPRSIGWQRAGYRLQEQNWGVLALLALALLPLGSGESLLVRLVDAAVSPLLAIAG